MYFIFFSLLLKSNLICMIKIIGKNTFDYKQTSIKKQQIAKALTFYSYFML